MIKKITRLLQKIQFACCIICLSNVAIGQNLLPNGDFEQNFTSWTNLSGSGAISTYSISTTDVARGTKAMKVDITKLGTVSYAVQSIHAGWPAQTGKLYTIIFYAKSLQNGTSLDIVHQNSGFTKKSFLLNQSWQQFEYMYTADSNDPGFKFQFPTQATYLIDAITITEFNPGNIAIPSASSRPLKELAAGCNLNIGSVGDQSTEANYSNTLKREYNIVVNENAMKMGSIKSTEAGAYNFTGTDNLLAFAQSNGMKMRGHCILWHEGMPDWVKNKAWTKQTLLSYLKTYITTVVGRYKGKIEEWDVANEFIGGNNDLRNGTESVWMKYIGEEVLDSAFKWVHQIDPNAKLYYNDYGAEAMNGKSNAVYALVKRLKDRGAPIHGLGMQCHFSYDQIISINSTFAKEMDQNIKRLGALGLQVSFTEIDLAMALPGDETKYKIQALSYGNLLKIALNNPTIVKSFLSWGFTDKHSWIPNFKPGFGDALIFNTTYAPKYAYNQMSNVLESNCAATEPKGPYTGTPINIAGTIEVENYDKGGEGISFHDTETANLGGAYRTDGVDIGAIAGGNFVGWTASGEWMEYSVNVTKTSSYDFKFFTSSLGGGGVLSLTVDGNPLLSNIDVPSTGDWNTYTSFSRTATLNQGTHVIRLFINNFGFNIDKIVVTEAATCSANISSPANAFCAGSSVVLTTSAGASYKWFNGTTQVGTAASYTATAAGSYTVEVTNASGCKATSPAKVITVNPLPVITYNVNTNGNWTAASTATVCATTNVIVGPWPVVETGWNWTGPNNFSATTREIYLNNTQANQSGIYTATYRDVNGCTASGTFNLQVNAATIWYADTDNDGKGNPLATISACTKPLGYVAVAGDACPTDATKITPGNCGCNKTENSCLDCAGVANGTAIIDACGKCAGGTTGIAIVTNPNQCITTTVPSISGALCVASSINNNYSFNAGSLSIASINWWTNSGATVVQNPANAKQVQINFPAYANGTNATITAGVNLNAAPWYQEFTLLVKVGGCTGSTPQLRASATPLPFNALTTVSLDNNEIINSVRVVDMNGVEVFNQNNINKNSFELGAELPTGMYIAYVTSSKGTSIVKLVKNN